jgi:hypothetical protein
MKTQMQRIVRTAQSEQYALFDLSRLDADGLPLSLGKLDLHYTDEGIYGTVVLWSDRVEDAESFVHNLMEELSSPMGVSAEYLVECMVATESSYGVVTNIVEDEEEPQAD